MKRTDTETGVLVFPGGMPAALEFAHQASRAGLRVVGASSVCHDPARASYLDWLELPYAHTGAFAPAILAACAERDLTRIYTPHIVVWRVLADLLEHRTDIRLWNESPALAMHRPLERCAAQVAHFFAAGFDLRLPDARRARAPEELAEVLLHAGRIEGMCDDAKILVCAESMRSAPRGDVVEIGVWCGKSSLALLLLARLFGIGPLLCIDPWTSAALAQAGSDRSVDRATASFDCAALFELYCANLRPYANGDANYLRMPASRAVERYGAASVTTREFGSVAYSGRIALLHLDGNHGPAAARQDCDTWIPHVMPGGWVVIDDYRWAFGAGPQLAADAWLERSHAEIECCFVVGETLFAKLRADCVR